MKKSELENAKIVFKCIDAISMAQGRNERMFNLEKLAYAGTSKVDIHVLPGGNNTELLAAINSNASKWASYAMERYVPLSYKHVFDQILLQ